MSKKPKEIFCSVHGFIHLTPLALEFVDTVEFQRLNWLHQLGASFLIFSSASHTRKSHAIGVYHLARLAAQTLQRHHPDQVDDRLVDLIGVAGLLHDIGHFAFSHVGDAVLADLTSPLRHHERRSEALLEHMVQKYQISMTDEEIMLVQRMINPRQEDKDDWRFQIVSGTIDVDRCDYVVRDSQNVGVMTGFGLHQVRHIIDHCRIVDKELAFHPKVARDCHDLLLARRDLHYKVYQHRVSVAIEAMLVDVIQLVEEHCKFKAAIHDLDSFNAVNDGLLMRIFFDPLTPIAAKELIQRIWDRRLYKCVFEMDHDAEMDVPRCPSGTRVHARWIGMDTGATHPMDLISWSRGNGVVPQRFWKGERHRVFRVSIITTVSGGGGAAQAFGEELAKSVGCRDVKEYS